MLHALPRHATPDETLDSLETRLGFGMLARCCCVLAVTRSLATGSGLSMAGLHPVPRPQVSQVSQVSGLRASGPHPTTTLRSYRFHSPASIVHRSSIDRPSTIVGAFVLSLFHPSTLPAFHHLLLLPSAPAPASASFLIGPLT